MPYINKVDRSDFGAGLLELQELIRRRGISNGELNYMITTLGLMYLDRHGKSYNTISDVIKAMECAKLEFYARVARPYEDAAKERNGDVF